MVIDENDDGLAVRPLRQSDLAWFVNVRNEAAVFLHDPRTFTVDDATAWFAQAGSHYRVLSVDGERAGYFRLSVDEADERILWIGADLAPEYRGRRLAKRAYVKFLDIFRDEFRAEQIRLRVLPTNTRAIALYRNLGFRTIGVAHEISDDDRSLIITDVEMALYGKVREVDLSSTDFTDFLLKP